MKRLTSLTGATRLTAVLIFVASGLFAQSGERSEYGAEYNYKRWHCEIKGNGFALKTAAKLTIHDARGDAYNEVQIGENSASKLKKVSMRVIDADGEVIYARDKGDMLKACGYGGGILYTDVCTYMATLEHPRYPYSIEYEYTLESKSLFYWRSARLQHYVPVKHAQYTLTAPPDFEFRYRPYGLDLEPIVAQQKSKVVCTWEVSDVPALDDVDYLPPGYNEHAHIVFVAAELSLGKYSMHDCSWREIGRWYQELYRDRYLNAGDDSTFNTHGSEREIARAHYDDIIREVRYVAIEDGIGGWRPSSATLTQNRGYGDCKDMSTLLISRLRNRGIKAHPCHVRTRDSGPLDTAFAAVGFNHVIAYAILDGDTVFMDPTCEDCPFGDLPQMDEDIYVVLDTDDGGLIWRTPASTSDDNKITRKTAWNIAGRDDVTFTTEMTATGNFAVYYRGSLSHRDEDETRRFVNGLFPGAEKKFRIERYSFENIGDIYEPVVIRIEAKMIKPIDEIGGTLYFNPFIFNKPMGLETEDLKDREFPVNLFYPETRKDEFTVTWDTSLAIDSVVIPQADSLAFSFGEVAAGASIANDTVFLRLEKAYFAYQVDVDQFENFDAFRAKLRKITNGCVKLVKK